MRQSLCEATRVLGTCTLAGRRASADKRDAAPMLAGRAAPCAAARRQPGA